jgi:L-lactate dehydrogenase complex protein LldF
LENRKDGVEEGAASFAEKIAWKFWMRAMLNRKIMNISSGKTKSWVVNRFVKEWKKHHGDLIFPKKSFNELWLEKEKDFT